MSETSVDPADILPLPSITDPIIYQDVESNQTLSATIQKLQVLRPYAPEVVLVAPDTWSVRFVNLPPAPRALDQTPPNTPSTDCLPPVNHSSIRWDHTAKPTSPSSLAILSVSSLIVAPPPVKKKTPTSQNALGHPPSCRKDAPSQDSRLLSRIPAGEGVSTTEASTAPPLKYLDILQVWHFSGTGSPDSRSPTRLHATQAKMNFPRLALVTVMSLQLLGGGGTGKEGATDTISAIRIALADLLGEGAPVSLKSWPVQSNGQCQCSDTAQRRGGTAHAKCRSAGLEGNGTGVWVPLATRSLCRDPGVEWEWDFVPLALPGAAMGGGFRAALQACAGPVTTGQPVSPPSRGLAAAR
ncbi:hypothetical protein BDK51DRAFT_49015 [Blyttiomyces helicus]|uniref:Uncharacterized protein n=1 Tax=Blyttiomyces helicus TaxID=388810 RepID=A0A4P9W073_9FUNG|nr:hypothetical protein BDK51DRAFT_49015 [Blyttiomyces helicus]|eukprot:RKO84483.1 hypothetical protein BDK51DRAFT_49015 [Blyttiomyces helicus]